MESWVSKELTEPSSKKDFMDMVVLISGIMYLQ